MTKFETSDNESRTPSPTMEDTKIPDEVVDDVEGKDYHVCVDKFGKRHIIKSPQLDMLKSLTQLSAQNASHCYLLAEKAHHRELAFGVCSLALFGITSAQYFLAGTFDKLDFALGLATLGATLVSRRQASSYLDTMTEFANANEKFSKDYQSTLFEIAHEDFEEEYVSMFG